jgi:AAA-like domain/Bacterial regulatory proteins, luxR family
MKDMKEAQFKAILDELTPKQRRVLHAFLSGQSDEAIATALGVETATVRRHLTNVCKAYGFSNLEGEHYSYRQELIDLFVQHRLELVHSSLLQSVSLSQPESALSPEPEFPGSPLTLDSCFYIARQPIEAQCVREIRQPGALIRIRAPQRMGKTSLVQRLISEADAIGYHTVRLNLRQAEASCLTDLDTFLRWFCTNLCFKLKQPSQLEQEWGQPRLGSLVNCTTYVQCHILELLNQPLLLALDEVDWLFEFPHIAQGFFTLLRGWHEEAKNLEIWQRLRLVIAHSTEVYIPLQLQQSPFNTGLPIRLPELGLSQVQQLSQHYRLTIAPSDLNQLMSLIGGHPYLVLCQD